MTTWTRWQVAALKLLKPRFPGRYLEFDGNTGPWAVVIPCGGDPVEVILYPNESGAKARVQEQSCGGPCDPEQHVVLDLRKEV